MEQIEKKINSFLGAAMGSMAMMILLGLVFALAPSFMISIMRWGIAIILLLSGAAMIARDMQSGKIFSIFSTSLMGVFLVLMGIIVAIYPETLNIITIAFGVYMILSSFMQISLASRIRGTGNAYNVALVTNLIGLICGVIMIVRPGDSNEAIVTIAGILLIIYGISGLIDTFILKSKIDQVKKTVKEVKKDTKRLVDDIKEAEIVDKKSKK
jgi:uncharacterized membrane protein HdeD (DUF308 family)